MKIQHSKGTTVLGLAPSTHGCGFAVIIGKSNLIAFGVKTVRDGEKNARTLSKVQNLISYYRPDVIAIEDTSAKGARRAPRIKLLIEKIVNVAKIRKIEVASHSRQELMLAFLSDERGTRYALAQFLTERYPEQLKPRLPRKQRIWESDGCGMDIFDAVALAEHHMKNCSSS